MTIKIKGLDFSGEIGGQFQDALDFVKGLKSRRFNEATRTWLIDLTKEEFRGRVMGRPLPMDYDDGTHRTAWGNTHQAREWTDRSRFSAREKKHEDRVDALRAELQKPVAAELLLRISAFVEGRSQAQGLGTSAAAVKAMEQAIRTLSLDRLRFATEARQVEAEAIQTWYGNALEEVETALAPRIDALVREWQIEESY